MADLDDFFAKKDKKKSKAKKFLTAEECVKNLEDTSKREVPPARVKKIETNASGPGGANDENKKLGTEEQKVQEEEWKDFEVEQQKDYTGLKIGQLSVNDDDDQSPTDGDDDDGDSEGNIGGESNKHGVSGPWKKVIPAEEVTQIPMEMEKTSSKLYISPALRHSQSLAATAGSARTVKSRRAAPDITNADYFPTLGAARPEEQRKKKNEPAFEEVRHGGRIQRVQEQAPAPVAATNRFQTLDEDDS